MISQKRSTMLLLGCLLAYSPIASAEEAKVKMEELLKTTTSWDGATYKAYPSGQPELSIVKVTIPPHTKMKWHTHPMPNAGYVLSGDQTVERQDGKAKQHVSAGQTIPETVGMVHRGVSGDAGAVLIVFYAGAKGMPLFETPKN